MRKHLLRAAGVVLGVLVLTGTIHALHWPSTSPLTFRIKVPIPYQVGSLLSVDYDPAKKFPHLNPQIRLKLSTVPKKTKFYPTEEIILLYSSSAYGFASIIDYSSDGKASILVLNRQAKPSFEYAYRGQVYFPEGADYIRLVFSQSPLGYESLKSLAEYPLDQDEQITDVIQEAWLRIEVEAAFDPFYNFPYDREVWLKPEGAYIFVQPYNGKVLGLGIKVLSAPRIARTLWRGELIDSWELKPGDSLEIAFDLSLFPRFTSSLYVLFFPGDGLVPAYRSLGEPSSTNLSLFLNGTKYQDLKLTREDVNADGEPIIVAVSGMFFQDINRLEITVDSLSEASFILRRIEMRERLGDIIFEASKLKQAWEDLSL